MQTSRRFRLIDYLVTIAVILTLNFMVPRLMPGDPFLLVSAGTGEEFTVLSERQREYFMSYYGLDKPLYEQFLIYLQGLVRGDLGYSIQYREEVTVIIARSLPWTIYLVLSATLLSTIFGIIFAVISAWHRGEPRDNLLLIGLVSISEIPGFLLGLSFLLLFSVYFGWFPLAGASTPFIQFDSLLEKIVDIIHYSFLPIIVLALSRVSGSYLLMRNTLIMVLSKDYMKTARAKGLPERVIRYRHALRNALLPLVNRIALQLGGLVGGAVLIENVFAYPGLGTLMADAALARDYNLLQGILLVFAVGVLIANFIADLVSRRLDPRIR
jgi:peptide/nickel transport system permease protein